MEKSLFQTRIAVLWIVAAIAMSAHMVLLSLDPAAMKKAAAWAVTARPGEWLVLAMFWLVPLWLAFLAVTLRYTINRWVNLTVAVIFTMVGVWHFFICGIPLLKGGPFAEPQPQHALLVGTSAAATILIAWYAWTWPRPKA